MSNYALLGKTHEQLIFKRRIHAIAAAIAPHLPAGRILDFGAGNGELGALLMQLRPDVRLYGVDVHLRPTSHIPIVAYDGPTVPFASHSFDAVIAVDVLHHMNQPLDALNEFKRISRGAIVIKDHLYRNPLEHATLRFMDWVGNRAHGVYLPYNYFSPQSWEAALQQANLTETLRQEYVPGQYPPIGQQLVGRRIQFVAKLST